MHEYYTIRQVCKSENEQLIKTNKRKHGMILETIWTSRRIWGNFVWAMCAMCIACGLYSAISHAHVLVDMVGSTFSWTWENIHTPTSNASWPAVAIELWAILSVISKPQPTCTGGGEKKFRLELRLSLKQIRFNLSLLSAYVHIIIIRFDGSRDIFSHKANQIVILRQVFLLVCSPSTRLATGLIRPKRLINIRVWGAGTMLWVYFTSSLVR